ncbi:MAG: Ig-like domain-containing protein [Salinivirgaceae bacterium]|jgi:hypothetical protein|nr:Ig-like domain-containing protein [Salinivirgaceae bacterium]
MTLREFWRFHFLKALLGLVVIQLVIVAIIQNYNHKPEAMRDSLAVIENRMLKIKPLTNDVDKDEDTDLSIKQFTNPLHGKVKQKGNSLFYTPENGYIGSDSLSYTNSDGKKESKEAYIIITVNENLAPMANTDAGMAYSGGFLAINPLANDEDREGDSIFIHEFTQPLNGKVELIDNEFIYSAGSIAVTDSFQYILSDGKRLSEPATVKLTIKGKNDPCYPWLSKDIGNVNNSGSLTCANNKITIEASGSDIWDSNDGFTYAYQAIEGNCEIIAKVESLEAEHEWAKAGLLIRENLSAGSANMFIGMTLQHGIGYQSRFEQNDGSNGFGGKEDAAIPYWIKLKREGNNFTGSVSADGKKWEDFSTEEIAMGKRVYVGLGVTSHNNSEMGKAVFSNAKIVK